MATVQGKNKSLYCPGSALMCYVCVGNLSVCVCVCLSKY